MNSLAPLAKDLRKNSTFAERLLWRHLKSKQVQGLKFRRQEPIGRYIVDFVCFAKKVVIELDGGQHGQEKLRAADKSRDEWLKDQGFTVLRFWNDEIMQNMEGVGEEIMRYCLAAPSPNPSHQGRGIDLG
ncbi:endonuclease domain-containing protein [Candidatus Uhrbacteria bacterium]|nr:endonuclease domain-containing protein [Candidatus Uhrbacteria bacterium]